MERLGHVVIGTGIDARHLVAPAVAGGKDEDRHGLAGGTPFFNDGNAIQLRQADIEDDGVIGLGVAEVMPLFAVECLIDDITGLFQGVGQLTIEIGIVLNNENTHCPPFPSVPAHAGGRSCYMCRVVFRYFGDAGKLHRHAHRHLARTFAIPLDENGNDTGLTIAGRIDRKQLTTGFAHHAGDGCAAIAGSQNVVALQISLGRRETGKPGCKRRDDER